MTPSTKIWLILVVLILAVVAVFLLPPIPQNEAYHRFADTRTWLGVSNCLDTISRAAFLLAGIWGLLFACREQNVGRIFC
jgi:di/tricarboxylate transporter